MFNNKRIKKLEAQVDILNKTVTSLMKRIDEQDNKLNPPTFGGRKQG